MSVRSNLGGVKHFYLGLVVRSTVYALLINSPFVRQYHPGKLVIHIAAIYHAQEELKHQYDKNLRVFHKTQVVERAIIHKLVLTV